jgi:hypothetical protein
MCWLTPTQNDTRIRTGCLVPRTTAVAQGAALYIRTSVGMGSKSVPGTDIRVYKPRSTKQLYTSLARRNLQSPAMILVSKLVSQSLTAGFKVDLLQTSQPASNTLYLEISSPPLRPVAALMWLTPQSLARLEKLIVAQPANKFTSLKTPEISFPCFKMRDSGYPDPD